MASMIGGLIAVVLGVLGVGATYWGQKGYVYLVKGLAASVPALLVIGGIIAFIAGIGSLKDRAATAREEAESAGGEEEKSS